MTGRLLALRALGVLAVITVIVTANVLGWLVWDARPSVLPKWVALLLVCVLSYALGWYNGPLVWNLWHGRRPSWRLPDEEVDR